MLSPRLYQDKCKDLEAQGASMERRQSMRNFSIIYLLSVPTLASARTVALLLLYYTHKLVSDEIALCPLHP